MLFPFGMIATALIAALTLSSTASNAAAQSSEEPSLQLEAKIPLGSPAGCTNRLPEWGTRADRSTTPWARDERFSRVC